MRNDRLCRQHCTEAGDAPGLLELDRGSLLEGLDPQHVRVVNQHVDARSIWSEGSSNVVCLRQIAGEMGVAAAVPLDRLPDFCRTTVAAGKTDDVMPRLCEGLGDLRTKACGYPGDEQEWTGHRSQIQRRMLAMMAICASQPAVKASVRAAGMPAE